MDIFPQFKIKPNKITLRHRFSNSGTHQKLAGGLVTAQTSGPAPQSSWPPGTCSHCCSKSHTLRATVQGFHKSVTIFLSRTMGICWYFHKQHSVAEFSMKWSLIIAKLVQCVRHVIRYLIYVLIWPLQTNLFIQQVYINSIQSSGHWAVCPMINKVCIFLAGENNDTMSKQKK